MKHLFSLLVAFVLVWLPCQASASPPPEARIVINIPSRTLWLYSGDTIVSNYPVGLGQRQFPTPTGRFTVLRMVANPTWEHPFKPRGAVRIGPGARNPLGTRWIGFKDYKGGEYGIHGTDRPGSIGRFSSHGCVRMKIHDAEALFDRVSLGTPVEVIYDVALIRRQGQEVRLITYPDAFSRGRPTPESLVAKIEEDYPGAHVMPEKLREALAHPVGKPVVVATLDEDEG